LVNFYLIFAALRLILTLKQIEFNCQKKISIVFILHFARRSFVDKYQQFDKLDVDRDFLREQ